ncbi:MAG: 50S ribosomal protein L29 [Candidatus Liptonbacteria bacterium]|nr:50S ribosomal protein L29 [Candidatus Liptonbacteria bacterium]
MKKQDIQQLRAKPAAELHKLIKDSEERLRKLRFDLAAGKVKNVAELRSVRKAIARMHTVAHERARIGTSTQ